MSAPTALRGSGKRPSEGAQEMTRMLHRRRFNFSLALAAVFAIGCAGSVSQRPPRNAEVISPALITGQWVGTYRAASVDRDGKFRMIVEQRGDSLGGWLDLVGVPPEPGRAVRAAPAGGDSVRVPIPSITQDGVRARFHSASYWDPGCGCALKLEITGFVVADTLKGYFHSTGTALMAPGEGSWRAVRVR
jgi:hypothetical protein